MNKTRHSNNDRTIDILSVLIIASAIVAAATGIYSEAGPGPFSYSSIRGEEITVYGQGIYQHMSEEVAIQGIAQDYFTLFAVLPLLVIVSVVLRPKDLSTQLILTGLFAYLFIQYLFYLLMAMYSTLFLLYALLAGTTFFAFLLSLQSIDNSVLSTQTARHYPRRYVGVVLLINTFAIALLWLSVVLPPLFDGSIYPKQVEHYTSLIVQGMDLGLLLPLAAVSALLLLRGHSSGYLYASVYTVFLSLQMLALCAKIAAMGFAGYSIIPVIFIIPVFFLLSGIGTLRIIRAVRMAKFYEQQESSDRKTPSSIKL
ncbi:MAG: hypothetical protein JXK93_02900 [Sphaerochaetaceae bacterium]|nr:hypothetical protein [Sphaerochaetaceae bacterium]